MTHERERERERERECRQTILNIHMLMLSTFSYDMVDKRMSIGLPWRSLAGPLVDAKRPGDLNQSLMELGATICSPAALSCSSCPIAKSCDAFALSKVSSGSLDAMLATNFPAKVVKASPRQDYVAVCVLEKGGSTVANMPRFTGSLPTGYFFLVKRPPTGLLAGLWEFPTVSLSGPTTSSKAHTAAIDGYLKGLLGIDIGQHPHVMIARETLGTYVHVFTHIRLHMVVEWMHISGHV